ncbi:MAG: ROK family protein [Chitinispirillaceae bacterium]|nr:ROK family protein [Chitinispirillaceae bacterium]
MNLSSDPRIVLTLDAGGTNFVFSAVRSNAHIVEPVTRSSSGDDLDRCLAVIERGFRAVMEKLDESPVAISFAFPGPADYPRGIIGDLKNLPAFKGGVPLGPILRNRFDLPVFINNDGDLYAYGEALSGFLPYVNELLRAAGNPKHYRNLLGVTLGTGFGGGIVRNETLFTGDNAMAGEVWLLRNRLNPATNAEEGISIRAVKRVYAEKTGLKSEVPEPEVICNIAADKRPGDRDAAREAFRQLGIVLGDALAEVLTLIDGLAVIGGGIAGAMEFIYPSMMAELRSTFTDAEGAEYPRIVQRILNLDDEDERALFLNEKGTEVVVPGTGETLVFYPKPHLGIGTSRLGTSKAIALGAYAFALMQLDGRAGNE